MAKIQCRTFPDDIYEKLVEDAKAQERSVEGHVRFLLTDYFLPLDEKPVSVKLPEWMISKLNEYARAEYRSLNNEILKRLTESLAKDGVNPPQEDKVK